MAKPANFFGGSPLNRLSWLRSSHSFLNAVIASPTTRWLVFKSGQPLTVSSPNDAEAKPDLAFVSTSDVKSFLGEEPYFGQGKDVGQVVSAEEATNHTEAMRHRGLPVVFLGLQEPESATSALPTTDFKDASAAVAKLEGTPFFSVDIGEAEMSEEEVDKVLKQSELGKAGKSFQWADARALMSGTDNIFHAGIFAEARSMLDWNQRNKFCPGCGSPVYMMWGGWKLSCSSLLPWADNSNRKPCPTAKGLHNVTHPRTDAVVIMIALDQTGEKILLGRSRRFPFKFYSALAGFIEPGESFEDAVAREMWEEAGVKAWDVTYHSSQPWPYPANQMVGFYARADSTKPVRTDLDNELVDAKWFTRSEVLEIINHPNSVRPFTRADIKKLDEIEKGSDNAKPSSEPPSQGSGALAHSDPNVKYDQDKVKEPEAKPDDPPFRIPPTTAIAGVLIRDWAEGKIQAKPETALAKGNL